MFSYDFYKTFEIHVVRLSANFWEIQHDLSATFTYDYSWASLGSKACYIDRSHIYNCFLSLFSVQGAPKSSLDADWMEERKIDIFSYTISLYYKFDNTLSVTSCVLSFFQRCILRWSLILVILFEKIHVPGGVSFSIIFIFSVKYDNFHYTQIWETCNYRM